MSFRVALRPDMIQKVWPISPSKPAPKKVFLHDFLLHRVFFIQTVSGVEIFAWVRPQT
ncbi:MAG: hypothetical protein QG636_5 [Patescibacteria group bacterium]|jgi:hypothetical protein|nr:hypothetical protein [Patescibacteria group bacterium]